MSVITGSTTVTVMLIVIIIMVVSHVPVKMDSLVMDLLVLVRNSNKSCT